MEVLRGNVNKGLPLNGDGHQSEHAPAHGDDSHVLRNFTVDTTEWPIMGNHVDEVEHDVQCRNDRIRYRQVYLF